MCGICGKLNYDDTPVAGEQIQRMCHAISHRGPDDEGVYLKTVTDPRGRRISIGLGHKRLSIIDLSEYGHQPMSNEDGTVWIVFNGEIYNYKTLRSDLEQKGHVFKSNSDTEVILHLYEENGFEAAARLNGMFAFAIWDERRGRLWLCRDRIGIKPLVYYWDGRNLAFASEIKSLLALPEIHKAMDTKALELYLAFSYVPAPYTIYKGIRKLEPGHSLVVEDGRIENRKFWEVPVQSAPQETFKPIAEGVNHYKNILFDTLSDAVTSRMIADVPLGAFLSGGIDSSIIVALMARHSARPVKTFSIGFKDAAMFDETRYAREVATLYQTDHHEFKLMESDMIDVLDNVMGAFDEPFADSSAIPTYIVSKYTRQHVTVALSGDGGDELFAGYRSYLGEHWSSRYLKIPGLIRRGVIEKTLNSLPDSRDVKWMEYVRRIKKFINATSGEFPERLLALKAVFPDYIRKEMIVKSEFSGDSTDGDVALKWVKRLIEGYSGDRINTMLYTDLKDSLPGDMLTKVDWMSMQHSLEVRVPFLDHRVVELAFQIPGDLKIHGMTTKYILKETFKDILPVSLRRRPKAGFEVPISQWLKTDLKFLITDYLSPKRIMDQGIFNFPVIDRLIKDFFKNRTDTSWMLWNLIVFQYWYEKYYK